MGDEGRNVQLVRQFFATLSTGDLEALRPLLHPQGSWEVVATTVPGAGRTEGGDAVIDEFLAPVRGLFAPGDPKVEVRRAFSVDDLVCVETEADGELTNFAAANRDPPNGTTQTASMSAATSPASSGGGSACTSALVASWRCWRRTRCFRSCCSASIIGSRPENPSRG